MSEQAVRTKEALEILAKAFAKAIADYCDYDDSATRDLCGAVTWVIKAEAIRLVAEKEAQEQE